MTSPVKYKIFRRLFMSFVLVVSAITILLSVILYSVFAFSTAKDFNRYNLNSLNQKNIELKNLSEQVNHISYQLLTSDEVINYIYDNSEDKSVSKYHLFLVTKDIYVMYPFISFIEFCDARKGEYFNTFGAEPSEIDEIRLNSFELVGRQLSNGANYITREISHKDSTKKYLSVVVSDYVNTDISIIVNIDISYIERLLGNVGDNKNSTHLIDAENNIIASSASALTNEQILSLIDSDRVYSKEEQGYKSKFQKETYFVNYVKCSDFDWYLVNTMQYDLTVSQRRLYFRACIFASLCFILIGVVAVSIMSRIIYKPVKKIMEKVTPQNDDDKSRKIYDETEIILGELNLLQEKVDYANKIVYKTQDATNAYLLTNLILGRKKQQTKEMLAFSDVLQYLLKEDTFFKVILFDFDISKDGTQESSDMDLYCYGMSNIIREMLSEIGRVETITVSPNRICALMSKKQRITLPYDLLKQISSECLNYMGSTLSIFVGDDVEDLHEIHKSYQTSVDYSELKFILGGNCLVDKKVASEFSELKENCEYNFTGNIIGILFRENKQEKLLQNTEQFLKCLCETKYSGIKKAVNQFASELREVLNKNCDILYLSEEEIAILCKQLASSELLSDFRLQLRDILLIVDKAVHNKNSTAQKHYDLILAVEEYVNRNFSDPSLSLTMIADEVNVSPGYLGKIFNNITDTSLVSYISGVRIENAKLKLATTELPVFKIAEEVGIHNPTYFTTLFKNNVGCTPAVYREKNRLNKYYNQ